MAPHLEQVVALVEDQGPLAAGLDSLEELPAVGVKKREEVLLAAALESDQAEVAAEVGGDVAVAGVARLERRHLLLEVRVVGIDVADRLVGQGGDRLFEPEVDPGADGAGLEGPPLFHPLGLDRCVGPEAEGAVSQPAGDLEAEQRLPRTGRHHDVDAPAAFRPGLLEGVEGEQLVAPEWLRVGDRREELAQLAGGHRLRRWSLRRERERNGRDVEDTAGEAPLGRGGGPVEKPPPRRRWGWLRGRERGGREGDGRGSSDLEAELGSDVIVTRGFQLGAGASRGVNGPAAMGHQGANRVSTALDPFDPAEAVAADDDEVADLEGLLLSHGDRRWYG